MFFVLGAVSAADNLNVSYTEDSNLIGDNDDSLSTMDKLEVSSADSISEKNIVNSHDDNLENDSDDIDALKSNNASDNEDYGEDESFSNDDFIQSEINTSNLTDSSNDEVIADSSSNDDVLAVSLNDLSVSASKKMSTKLSISDAHYGKSATYFKVTLKDKNDKVLSNKKISLKVKSKTYSATTNSHGVATIKTDALSVGKHTVSLSYDGNKYYSSSSLSKKVSVLSSVSASDLTKYYGYSSYYEAKFWKNGAVLSNTEVSFKVSGKTYKMKTNKNGIAKLRITLDVGKYRITTTNPYTDEKVSNKIVVKKDNVTVRHGSKVTYLIPKDKSSFSVELKSKHNALVKNQKIVFTLNGKKVTAKTDKVGKATITIPGLSKGTYKIYYKFAGNKNYNSKCAHSSLIVQNPSTKFTSSPVKMYYKGKAVFKVKFTTKKHNRALVGKEIKFRLNGKYSFVKTNSKGIAKLPIKGLDPGNYRIKFFCSQKGNKYYVYDFNNVTVKRAPTSLYVGNLTMKYGDGSTYKATVKDKSGKLLKGVTVKSIINGKIYHYKTNSKGVAKLKIKLGVGTYTVKTVLNDTFYKSSKLTRSILVNGVKFIAHNKHVASGNKVVYSVKLIDGKGKPLTKRIVKFTFKGKDHYAKSNSKGVAKINLGELSVGKHIIKFKRGIFKGSATIRVGNEVTLKQIISASKNVRDYIIDNSKLPSKVKIGKNYYSTAKYYYLACKAIANLKAGKSGNIDVKNVKGPSKPGPAENLGNLYDYLSVAKSIIKTAESKGKMPNYVNSKVGSIGYKGAVYALARVVAFYGDNNVMPSYTAVKSLSESSTSKLNDKNHISKLGAYLAASTNCQVDNAKIKALVSKLTKGCTSAKQKATAIYNYVRDTVSYSFYYDTRYGAVGTLNAKTGNCVDHSHLLVAMFRTADLPARYVHGTCTFSSGGTYGHVWSQVLIGDTWTVADATSSRNSFGYVVNWNANSYSLHGHYSSLSF